MPRPDNNIDRIVEIMGTSDARALPIGGGRGRGGGKGRSINGVAWRQRLAFPAATLISVVTENTGATRRARLYESININGKVINMDERWPGRCSMRRNLITDFCSAGGRKDGG